MLSSEKLKNLIKNNKIATSKLVDALVGAGLVKKAASAAVKNWTKGLMKPAPRTRDIEALAGVLNVEVNDISEWKCVVKYSAGSSRKARLVTQLISGRTVQSALDTLKFTNKRAAYMVEKALKSAIANADEAAADVENLYVSHAKADSAGVRLGTKRWIAKDRGRAHSIRKMASHIYITVTEVD
ncbi:MAG: 50S ribosomal protein L22 [Anaerohalosphaeraceae bacterium]|nr:50S ribosomal protein L22 [Anaerohalosphaeraceae bacterium]